MKYVKRTIAVVIDAYVDDDEDDLTLKDYLKEGRIQARDDLAKKIVDLICAHTIHRAYIDDRYADDEEVEG